MNMHYYNAGLLCSLTANVVVGGVSIAIFSGVGLYWFGMALYTSFTNKSTTDQ